MHAAALATIQLARFDQLRANEGVAMPALPGTLFCNVAADVRAAGTEPSTQEAFTFVHFALHAERAAAEAALASRARQLPWFGGARENYAAILEPYRHKGEANFLAKGLPANAAPVFENLAPPLPPEAPFIAITSAGWDTGAPDFDMERVKEFSLGVGGVRASMTAIDGLHAQHSFSFPGVLAIDPITVSFWRDDLAVRNFAYGAGVHRHQMEKDRAKRLSSRTSFTRYRVLHGEGTWFGVDPLGRWAR
jgi:hypothetical protein